LWSLEQPLRSISWQFNSDIENDPRVEFLEEARKSMTQSWNDHVVEILTMLPFGFSLFEIVYKLNDSGQYVWRKFAPRGQETVNRWLFDDSDGGLKGFEQVSLPDYTPKFIPIEKLVLYRTRIERGNPEGRSLLRTAWIPYYFAKHIQSVEAIGIERDLAGLPVITLPAGADTADNDQSDFGKARKMVRNIRNDEQAGIVLPSPDWTLALLSTGGSRQFDTDKIVRRYESRMLMAALAQFLLLGQDGVGSLALSGDQTDFFNMSLNAIADVISETFTKFAIPRLLALNGMDPEGVRLEHTPPGDTDITKIADFLQKTGSLMQWTAEDEVWLRQVGGMPERNVEDVQTQMDDAQASKDAAAAVLQENLKNAKQNGGGQDGAQNNQQMDKQKMSASLFAASAPDDWKRRRAEAKLKRATEDYFTQARKRILKAVKEMKNDLPA
jgi:hypothetical protein